MVSRRPFNASPYARGGEKEFDHNAELLRFFDAHLRGVAAAGNAGPRVDYYTMGQERWKTSNTWPPPGVEWRSLFLAANHRLADTAAAEAEGEADDRYRVDRELTSGQGSRWGLIVTSGGQRRYGDFDLLPTSFEFPAGHSIRLSIAGADDVTFRAPLLVDPLIYWLHRDRQHQSRLELPTYSGAK